MREEKLSNRQLWKFDQALLFSVVALLGIGFVMLTSASLPLSERMGLPLFHFARNQAIYISLGIFLAYIVTNISIATIEKYSNHLLVFSIILLSILLLPGIARPINGSVRWLLIGPVSFQVSELAKLSLVLYISGYMVRRSHQMQNSLQGFLIPMIVLAAVAFLLLLEPDFGAVVVIASTILGMLFLGGARLKHFMILLPLVVCVLIFLGISSSYRVQRFISFRDPWADQFDTGYQLVQSLIAFGRGSWIGTGLGGSVQKLLYLPESHSDFIFAVIAEELGLVGVILVLFLFSVFAYRAMEIGRIAKESGKEFAGNLAYGIGLLITLQAIINISVNIGLLPTKGLNLPFMSAGGSSMLVTCIAVGILFRIDFEKSLVKSRDK